MSIPFCVASMAETNSLDSIGPNKLSRLLSLLFDRWRESQHFSPAHATTGADSPPVDIRVKPSAATPVTTNASKEVKPCTGESNLGTTESHALPAISSQPVLPDSSEMQNMPSMETDTSSDPQAMIVERAAVGDPQVPLPLRPAATPSTPVAATSHFLIVDDNAINLKILKTYMTKLKCMFQSATNGQEALDAYKIMDGDRRCVLMDISMPVMDGLEATRRIRSFEASQELEPAVIIALTGLGSYETQQQAFSSGVDLFLTKPVQLKELGSILTSRGMVLS